MKIFLIRHGDTEHCTTDIDDTQRPLSEEGWVKLHQDLPILSRLLNTLDSVAIWSSPILRSKQTAEILHDSVPNSTLIYENFLANGDLATFKKKLSGTQENCLVIVGHSPYLNNWISTLSDQKIQLQQGETVEIELPDKNIWQAHMLSRFHPMNYRQTLNMMALSHIFSSKHQDICTQKSTFLAQADTPKSVHNLRISIRRYRSLIALFSPLFYKKTTRELEKSLKYLLKEEAKLREMDVLIKQCQRHLPSSAKHQNTVLINALKQLRKEEMTRLLETISSQDFDEHITTIFNKTQNTFNPNKLKDINIWDYIESRINVWLQDVKKIEKHLNVKSLKDIHAYRIRWKKLHYALELTTLSNTPSQQKINLNKAKQFQDDLGCICDAHVNIQFINTIFKQHPDKTLQKEKNTFIKKEKARGKRCRDKLLKKKHHQSPAH